MYAPCASRLPYLPPPTSPPLSLSLPFSAISISIIIIIISISISNIIIIVPLAQVGSYSLRPPRAHPSSLLPCVGSILFQFHLHAFFLSFFLSFFLCIPPRPRIVHQPPTRFLRTPRAGEMNKRCRQCNLPTYLPLSFSLSHTHTLDIHRFISLSHSHGCVKTSMILQINIAQPG